MTTCTASRTGTAVTEELVRSHLPLVGHLVRELLSRVPAHVSREDLLSAGMAALAGAARAFDPDGTIGLGVSHQVSGNPIRFVQGAVRIRDDDEWSREMSAAAQAVVNAVTTPVRQRYGYRSNRPSLGRLEQERVSP